MTFKSAMDDIAKNYGSTNFREKYDQIDRRLDEHHTEHWIHERDLWQVLLAMYKGVSSVTFENEFEETEFLQRAKLVGMKH